MSDIYPAKTRPVARLGATPQPLPPEPPTRKKTRFFLLVIGLPIVAGLLFYGVRAFVVRSIALRSASMITERVAQAKQALRAFDVSGAETAFIDIKDIVADVQSEARKYGLLQLANVASLLYPPLSNAPQALDVISRLSDSVLSIIQTSELLKSKAFEYMVQGQGQKLVSNLATLEDQVRSLGFILEEMKESAAALDYPIGEDLLAFRTDLYKSERLLSTAIAWLSDVSHVAITFINPSEIRPGGGFPGSYAGVTLAHGNLGAIEVRDIYDPDGQLDLKIIPPKELQSITGSWGARDANWFFDFPTSARKTLYFLNNSKIYSEQDLKFDALLAVNVNAVSDILLVTGPIALPEYDLTLTSENFLDEIQAEVRSGVDRIDGEPKRILKVLTPILFEKLGQLTATQKQELIGYIQERFAAKDMIAYMEDPLMQAYLEQLSIAGEVDQSREGDLNEYLAVVNANIGGSKSDAVISQHVTLKSQIDLEGKINNTLTITRAHNASVSAASWYNTTNKNFFQIYTPRGSRALSARGSDVVVVSSGKKFDGYKTDADLKAIEKSVEPVKGLDISQTIAFNKTVFSGWLNTAPRTKRTFEMQYTNPQSLTGRTFADYTFIFEKQPGVDTALLFSIDAPPEYEWKESNNPNYTYKTDSAPGKLEINLTLIPTR